jgi:hypothetical protein
VFDPWLLLIRLRPQAALGISWLRSFHFFQVLIFPFSVCSERIGIDLPVFYLCPSVAPPYFCVFSFQAFRGQTLFHTWLFLIRVPPLITFGPV